MYKLIATDLDGTLLTSDKKITDNSIEAINNIKEKDYIFVAVTARSFNSIKSICDISIFDYIILNNGTSMVRNGVGSNIAILDKDIPYNIVKELNDVVDEIDCASLNNYYILNEKHDMGVNFRIKVNSIDEIDEDICRMNIILKDNTKLDYYKDYLNNKYNVNVFIMEDTDNKSKWLVVNPRGINKERTLEDLGNELGISLDEMIFFGDSLNDLEVMDSVGYSIAVSNAVEEVKQKANNVTLSNDEDGVAYILNSLK